MLSSVTELHTYIDRTQLTQELGGPQEYCHEKWISHRTVSTPVFIYGNDHRKEKWVQDWFDV